jgi:AraC family transcriptional regulator, regulatory protein of adaptative response / DNA-3-methyladenine glycosylase II
MPVEVELKPRGPYSLRLSGRLASDQTRIVRGGVYDATIAVDGRLERVAATQRLDGTLLVRAESDAGVDHVRFALGLDDDHTELLRRFGCDPLIGEATRRLRGLRPLRTATVAHALLRAVSGQLIQARRARQIEAGVIRSTARRHDRLYAAPSSAELGSRSPAELARLGLGARRASTLVRLCRGLDLESLKQQPTEQVARRLEREPGLGPWSVGVVCLQGLGRYERGLARDLGLVKLVSLLRGRRAEPEETDELLAPYGEWAGLASVYLLAAFHAGYIRFADGGIQR